MVRHRQCDHRLGERRIAARRQVDQRYKDGGRRDRRERESRKDSKRTTSLWNSRKLWNSIIWQRISMWLAEGHNEDESRICHFPIIYRGLTVCSIDRKISPSVRDRQL